MAFSDNRTASVQPTKDGALGLARRRTSTSTTRSRARGRGSGSAHTERRNGKGGSRPSTQLFADAIKLPTWQSSNKKKPSLLYQPKFGRKGIEANL